MRYQSAPRNIYRHVILSEMKEATAALPLVRGPCGAQAVPLPDGTRVPAAGAGDVLNPSHQHEPSA